RAVALRTTLRRRAHRRRRTALLRQYRARYQHHPGALSGPPGDFDRRAARGGLTPSYGTNRRAFSPRIARNARALRPSPRTYSADSAIVMVVLGQSLPKSSRSWSASMRSIGSAYFHSGALVRSASRAGWRSSRSKAASTAG